MCIFTGDYNLEEATGYKLVLKTDDKYISIFTGIEYIEKSFIKPPKYMNGFIEWSKKGEMVLGEEKIYGYTSIFNELESVQWFEQEIIKGYPNLSKNLRSKLVIIEMILTRDLKYSYMMWNLKHLSTISGKFIKQIKEYE